jgi:hypothetical protein
MRQRDLEHFQGKWIRFTVENASDTTTRADSISMERALGFTAKGLIAMVRIGIAAGLLLACIQPGSAKDCRIPDAPPGVRVQLPPGCEAAKAPPTTKGGQQPARTGREPGFVDLGNGTEVRIGGGVRADTVFHR